MIEGISHITFIVSDLERTTSFFEAIFDAKVVYSSGDKTFSIAKEVFFLIGNQWIAIMESEASSNRTYDHIAFKICDDEFEGYESRIHALGVEIIHPRTRIDGEGRSLYFYDFDNHLFELHTGTLRDRLTAYESEL